MEIVGLRQEMAGSSACFTSIERMSHVLKLHGAHCLHFIKAIYWMRNWPTNNAALCQRNSITMQLSSNKIDDWQSPKRDGRSRKLMDTGTLTGAMLTLWAIYHPSPRQIHGFTKRVFKVLGLDLAVASASTLPLRRKTLAVKPWSLISEPLDLVVDGTGLKIFGQGEWCGAKHGNKSRGWDKVHIGLDANSGMIAAHVLTDQDTGDPGQVDDLLEEVDGVIGQFTANGVYSGNPVSEVVRRHSSDPLPEVIIPSRHMTVLSSAVEAEETERSMHFRVSDQGPDGLAEDA